MKNFGPVTISLIIFLVTHPVLASGNSEPDGYAYWFEMGLIGTSYSDDIAGYGSVTKLALSKGRNVFSFRNLYHHNGDNVFACIGHAILLQTCSSPTIEFHDEALLFGRKLKGTDISLSAGIGRVEGTYTKRPDRNFTTTGLAFDVDWHFITRRHFGFSLNLSGNVNREQPFYGAYITFSLGKLD